MSLFDINSFSDLWMLLEDDEYSVNELDNTGKNALFFEENVENIRLLLKYGINVNQIDVDGKNALFKTYNPEIVRLLVDAGINVNQIDNNGENALFDDVSKNTESLRLLLDAGINVNHLKSGNENVLFKIKENPQIVRLLLNAGINVNQINSKNENVLFSAVSENADCLRLLLDAGININHINSKNENCLFSAISTDTECLRLLLDAGINVNQINFRNENALFNVTENSDSLRLLLKAGININHLNSNHENVLFIIEDVNFECVKVLIDAGININEINNEEQNILFYNVANNPECLRLLISKGINVNQIDNRGRNILFYLENENSEILRILLDAGIDVNKVDNNGMNALFDCNIQNSRLLIDAGININQINDNGLNVFQYNSYLNQLEFQILLVEKGFDFSFLKITTEIYSIFFIEHLLKYGYNINNISKNVYVSILKEYGHDAYLDDYEDEVFDLNMTGKWRIRFIKTLRRSPDILPLNKILEMKNLEMLSLLLHNKFYPNIEIFKIGTFKLDSLAKIRLFINLDFSNNVVNLTNLDKLSISDQNFLNTILAPLFINQLYLHPITQKVLLYKEEITGNEENYDYYKYYLKNSKKLFSYLSEDEKESTLRLIKTDIKNFLDRNKRLGKISEKEYSVQIKELEEKNLFNLLF